MVAYDSPNNKRRRKLATLLMRKRLLQQRGQPGRIGRRDRVRRSHRMERRRGGTEHPVAVLVAASAAAGTGRIAGREGRHGRRELARRRRGRPGQRVREGAQAERAGAGESTPKRGSPGTPCRLPMAPREAAAASGRRSTPCRAAPAPRPSTARATSGRPPWSSDWPPQTRRPSWSIGPRSKHRDREGFGFPRPSYSGTHIA